VTNKKIDTQLIRNYGSYFRADVVGLKAGTYTLKVTAVTGGVEGESAETAALTVRAHDRTGFAFSNGRVPGAYKADGTPKENAVVIYITEKTKNTVSLTVTGANANPCVGLQAILDGFKKGKDTRPLIVRLVGQITDPAYMLGGDIVIENNNNAASYITFEGIGEDAVADGWGIRVKNASNIEISNLGTMNCNSDEGDNIGLQQDNEYIWVHNCDLFYGNAGSDADQIKGDGAMDCKKSTYVSFSYNHFWDSGKSNLLGLSEGLSADLLITYHHNWYDHSDSRHPRVRFYSAHVYNNYYDGNAKYGIGATEGASVFAEANYFRNCKYPMLTSMQGTDVWDETKQANDYTNMPTFSKENGGTIKAYNNYMSGQRRFVPYGAAGYLNSTVDFDAYVASTRSEQITGSIVSNYGKNTYNNFDTNTAVMYAYTPDSPEAAKENVMLYAGRMNGGDLKWTFNNAVDDASYTVNTGLKAALTNYKTTLVAVQGETPDAENSQTLSLPANLNQTVAGGTAISPIVFTWGGDATDATVTGLPASGIDVVKDVAAKTITITGIPVATFTYVVTTTGTAGTPATASGTITVSANGGMTENVVHNFTTSGKTSTFFTISGNLSTTKGTVVYDELTLTQCLKMESATTISFSTTQPAKLTLVFNTDFTGKVTIDGKSYTPTAGILTVNLAAGTHLITKGDTSNLFYMSVIYDATGTPNTTTVELLLYPNPVSHHLSIASDAGIVKTEIYSLSGVLLQQTAPTVRSIDMSHLSKGNYLVKVYTERAVFNQVIIKK
jgi:pectate lyase